MVITALMLGAAAFSYSAPVPSAVEEHWTWGKLPELGQWRAVEDAANGAIIERNFAALEAMATLYRTGAAPGIGGSSSLPNFYDAIIVELLAEQPKDSCAKHWQGVLDQWHKAVPRSGTAAIVEAQLLYQRAWCLRGADKAADVRPENWRPFRAELSAAAELLEENAARAGSDPEYTVTLAAIYLDQQRPPADLHRLIDAASAHDPYYYGFYYAAYRQAQPQWGGSPAAVDAVARYAVERTAARDGMSAYFRVYWHMVGCACWGDLAAVDRPMLRSAMRDMAERYPGDWTFLQLAQLSCLLGEREEARVYLARLRVNDATAWVKDAWQQCRTLVGPSNQPAPLDQMIDRPWPAKIG